MKVTIVLAMIMATLVAGQRPFFAGTRPIGYPELTTTEGLGDRFGEIDGTTQKIPIEANGDRDLIDRLSKLPIDKQPFWFINWQANEAHRQKPQTYPQRPNPFIDPPQNPASFNTGASGNVGIVSNTVIPSNTGNPNNSTSSTSITNSQTFNTASRFGEDKKDQQISPNSDNYANYGPYQYNSMPNVPSKSNTVKGSY